MLTDKIIYKHLKTIGIPVALEGYRCVVSAVRYAVEHQALKNSITTSMYPTIAKEFGISKSSVERRMRYAIEFVFDNTDPDVLKEYFGSTISTKSGKMTNGRFIMAVAEYIKMEEDL